MNDKGIDEGYCTHLSFEMATLLTISLRHDLKTSHYKFSMFIKHPLKLATFLFGP